MMQKIRVTEEMLNELEAKGLAVTTKGDDLTALIEFLDANPEFFENSRNDEK
jgi:hypothetical protein